MTVEVPDDIRASARFKCANAASTVFKKMAVIELNYIARRSKLLPDDAPLGLQAARV